jgi:hypothetical protein
MFRKEKLYETLEDSMNGKREELTAEEINKFFSEEVMANLRRADVNEVRQESLELENLLGAWQSLEEIVKSTK